MPKRGRSRHGSGGDTAAGAGDRPVDGRSSSPAFRGGGKSTFERERYEELSRSSLSDWNARVSAGQRQAAALGLALRGAQSWAQFGDALRRVNPERLETSQATIMLNTYARLWIESKQRGSSASSSASGAAGSASSPSASSSPRLPHGPPAFITNAVAGFLADAAPFVHLIPATFMLASLSRAVGSELASKCGGHTAPLPLLLTRLELLLSKPEELDFVRRAGAGAEDAASGAPRGPPSPKGTLTMGALLSMIATSLRRLGVRAPAPWRSLAEAAEPCMRSGELAGDQLALVVNAYSTADNPEPRFLDAALTAATSPAGLARLTAPFFAAAFFTAAIKAGRTEPELLNPMADKLVELIAAARQRDAAGAGQGEGAGTPTHGLAPGDGSPKTPGPIRHHPRPLTDENVLWLLRSCEAAGFTHHRPLARALLEEAWLNRGSWSALARLQAAQHLLAFEVDVLGEQLEWPAAQVTSQAAPAATSHEAGEPRVGHGQQAAAAAAAASPSVEADETAGAARDAGGPLVREEEVTAYMSRPTLTVTELIMTLQCLVRLRSAGSGAARDGADAAAPPPTSRMPSALATAVQLVQAAAPLMRPRQVIESLAALTAAGLAAPPALLAHAQKLYNEHAAAGASAAALAAAGDAEASTAALPSDNRAREVEAMCAAVGRLLAWQVEGAAAAAGLADGFLLHCRTVAARR
ncbi:hypothetical protein GPECTOR_6g804 [Gonium pectorale]|uniref:Uncharacterized protein n=1 Tax=Gonium pectorale TaxID=33097 RepID=A0A150GVH9_GONPE|nr:hypothetical protein GPECTOR_6g804 [Gonium pectorale]|eukprot:KXZ53886.1 hypothetical protein GPECTOR_6g804 [Gonium pectorale]